MASETKPQPKQSRPFLWQRQVIAGSPIERHGIRIIPQSEAISLSWASHRSSSSPFWLRLIYDRPTGLLLEQGQTTEYIPIVDVTRLAQISLWALALLFLLLPWLFAAKPKSNRAETSG